MNQTETDKGTSGDTWKLRLYIAGQTPRSLRAVANIHALCASRVDARYRVEVIDLYQQPQLAAERQIIAVPVLFRGWPPPARAVIGDLSDADSVIDSLELVVRQEQ